MKIISKFHDYYDTALGHGFDPHVIYERKQVEYPGVDIEDQQGYSPFGFYELGGEWHRWKARTPVEIKYASWCLLFCGRPYPFYVVQTPKQRDDGNTWATHHCYTSDDVARAIAPNKKRAKAFEKTPKYRWGGSWRSRDGLNREEVTERFAEVPKNSTIDALHRKYRAPAILVRSVMPNVTRGTSDGIIVNPVLKALAFQRAVDPYTAFQEISMYMGGVLGRPEMEHDPIPDDAMRDMKGFDEFSFKQISPGDKKARRKQNRIRKQG